LDKTFKNYKKNSIHIIGFCLSSPTFYVPCQLAMMEQQQLANSATTRQPLRNDATFQAQSNHAT
jgi:hypothetical protein